jgi:hypothetical protein
MSAMLTTSACAAAILQDVFGAPHHWLRHSCCCHLLEESRQPPAFFQRLKCHEVLYECLWCTELLLKLSSVEQYSSCIWCSQGKVWLHVVLNFICCHVAGFSSDAYAMRRYMNAFGVQGCCC